MYKSHQERNGAFNKSSVWKSLTSKTYVVILCLLVLFIVSVSAEEEVHYGYSIQVKDAHGLSLPKPIIPIDHLSKGLTIEICNLTDKPDSFMLVFICDNSVMR